MERFIDSAPAAPDRGSDAQVRENRLWNTVTYCERRPNNSRNHNVADNRVDRQHRGDSSPSLSFVRPRNRNASAAHDSFVVQPNQQSRLNRFAAAGLAHIRNSQASPLLRSDGGRSSRQSTINIQVNPAPWHRNNGTLIDVQL